MSIMKMSLLRSHKAAVNLLAGIAVLTEGWLIGEIPASRVAGSIQFLAVIRLRDFLADSGSL